MNTPFSRRLTALLAILALTVTLPVSALLLQGDSDPAAPGSVDTFAKNGPVDGTITFSVSDFVTRGGQPLDSILLTRLPALNEGCLTMGDELLTVGDAIGVSALNGLSFRPLYAPVDHQTSFSFTPVFADGSAGEDVTVELFLLTGENGTPIAENLTLTTYKNVAVTQRFSAVDPEGDLLSYRLADKPSRGSVELGENGAFTYTPYENKTGKDTFTYVAVDTVGNVSKPATVKIRIEKPDTRVTYADLDGSPAQLSAIRLAEENIFVGECMNGQYFFRPEQPVTRNEFLAMTLKASGQETLTTISRTGFADDAAIPTWAKGYVASGLKAGVIQGSPDESGQFHFHGNAAVTRAEASVLLDRVLRVTHVSKPASYPDSDIAPVWAYQSAVDLETAGVLTTDETGALALSQPLTRGDAAQLLVGALDLLESRRTGWFV